MDSSAHPSKSSQATPQPITLLFPPSLTYNTAYTTWSQDIVVGTENRQSGAFQQKGKGPDAGSCFGAMMEKFFNDRLDV